MFRKNRIEKLVRQRLVVTVKPGCGHDFSGVLLQAARKRDDRHTFVDVEMYLPDTSPEQLAGEVYVAEYDVALIQKVPPKVPHADH